MYCKIDVEFGLIKKKKIEDIIPLLSEIYREVPETTLKQRLQEAVDKGYECIGIYNKGELIGICGLWMLVKLGGGKHIELDNVYIKSDFRNQGVGKELNFWIKKFAQTCGCDAIELDCFLENQEARRFWEEEGFKAVGTHYQKLLND